MTSPTFAAFHEECGELIAYLAAREHRRFVSVTVEDLQMVAWLAIDKDFARVSSLSTLDLIHFACGAMREFMEQQHADYLAFMGRAS